ncbi:MAG TPA: PAS domain-containing sensor histidine kinase [Candidatus Dormibacteraeota bacterium]|nr:PAS domain-containing sensor histidine kinase [Candidatus Dormibacteraeota bacterium]
MSTPSPPTYPSLLRPSPLSGADPHSPGSRVMAAGLGLRGWRAFTIAAAVAGTLAAAFVAWTAFRVGGDQATIAVDDIGEAVAAFIAAASCGLAAAKNQHRTRIAWGLFAASAASWGIGETIWSVYEVGLGVGVPFPSAADAGYLLAVPLAVGGVFAFISAPSRLTTRGEALLAGAIVALSLLFIAWAIGLGQVYSSSPASPAAKLIGLAYPLGDIVTITVLVLAIRGARRTELGRMLLLLGGLASAALADSTFALLTANGTFGATGSVLDSGWVVGYLMIALAPLWPTNDTEAVKVEGPIELWQLALPWAAVLAAAVVAIGLAGTGHVLDRFGTVLVGGVGVLLVCSQLLSHRDSLFLLVTSRRMEAQLARRNSLLDQIVTHAPLGIARVGADMKIIDVNPRLAALLHTEAGHMVGIPVAAYLHPDEFNRVFETFQPLWKGTVDTIESDTHALRADQTEVWLHWSATVVRNSSGRIDYFLAMYEDTDADHAANEAAAAHLAGLERLNQLKSEFVALVSHEFRTALVGIQGFSEMIRDSDITIEDAKGFAADINQDAERLNRMINDMLDLDRIEAGRLTLKLEPLNINKLLSEAVARARASSARHVVICDFDSREPVVQCDPDRIAQIITNLLSNAIKYSPEGGEVVVSSRAEDGYVDVSVRDRGIGIAPEFVKRLFSRYERYEKTSGRIIGTGLGLAITRQIVELHGGKIWVATEQGNGSDFHFTLPLAPTEAPPVS